MAVFKRLKLFVNLSQLDPNNIIYDEVWIYKLKTGNDTKVGRYRIRYQKSDNPMIFSGEEDVGPEDYADIQSAFSQFGPAIVCYLEVWAPSGWKRCLDWMGDPGVHHISACADLNDQYKAFLTGTPILEPFISSPDAKPRGPGPKRPKRRESPENIFNPKPDVDPDEFDWI